MGITIERKFFSVAHLPLNSFHKLQMKKKIKIFIYLGISTAKA